MDEIFETKESNGKHGVHAKTSDGNASQGGLGISTDNRETYPILEHD